jgi:hypothetical protein
MFIAPNRMTPAVNFSDATPQVYRDRPLWARSYGRR